MAVGSLLSNAIGFLPYGKSTTLMGREDASESYVRGSVLKLTGGRLAEISADDTADIVGVAQRAATTTTDAEALYWPAVVNQVFEATFEDEQTVGHTIAIANLYQNYSVQIDSDGIHYVDQNDTGNDAVILCGLRDWQDMSDATARTRVLVRFLKSATIYDT